MENEKIKDLVTKYRLVIAVREGKEGLSASSALKNNADDYQAVVKMKTDIVKYLREKEAIEKSEKEDTRTKFEDGTLPIEVIERRDSETGIAFHFVKGDWDALSVLYGYNTIYRITELSVGKHFISELVQWQSWKQKTEKIKKAFSQAKTTMKPVLLSEQKIDTEDERGVCTFREYALPDGNTTTEITNCGY